MSAKRIILLVVGSIVALIGLAIAVGGGAALGVHLTQRDEDGYFETSTERLETARYAVLSEEVDTGADDAAPVDLGDLVKLRIRAEGATGRPVFVGIGPRDEVDRYLRNVAADQIEDLDFDPFRVTYRPRPGTRRPAPPAGQDLWVAQASGPGRQTVDWELESGRWTLVLMNADGTPGVAADTQLGVKVGILLPVSIGLLIGGLVILGVGVVIILLGGRAERAPAPDPAPGHEPPDAGSS